MVVANHSERRYVHLTQQDRQVLAWSSTPSRRHTIPTFTSTLQRCDTRSRSCATCRKMFSNVNDMKKHVALTHTGTKPVVCEICGKRFDSTKHMLSHYELHKEPRLQEFGILTRRRKAQSEPRSSSSSKTTIGTYHRVPKAMKGYASPSSNGSNGTQQTFHVSEDERRVLSQQLKNTNIHNMAKNDLQFRHTDQPSLHTNLPKIESNARFHSSGRATDNTFSSDSQSGTQTLPSIDPGSITVIGSVTGMNRVIETNKQSNFLQKTEDKLIKARLDQVSLVSPSPTPRSIRTKSSFSDSFRQRPPTDMPFWDSGSVATRRMSGVTAMSGYDPVLENRSISSPQKRVSMFPNINQRK